MLHRLLLTLLIGSGCCLPASATAPGPAAGLPQAVEAIDGDWLRLSELAIVGLVPSDPALVEELPSAMPLTALRQALGLRGVPPAVFDGLPPETVGWRLADGRWVLVERQAVLVRRSAIQLIDDRAGSAAAWPPTPAPGSAGAGVIMPLPRAVGVTVGVGTSRIFVGVRLAHQARTDQVGGLSQADLEQLAEQLGAPDGQALLRLLQ